MAIQDNRALNREAIRQRAEQNRARLAAKPTPAPAPITPTTNTPGDLSNAPVMTPEQRLDSYARNFNPWGFTDFDAWRV